MTAWSDIADISAILDDLISAEGPKHLDNLRVHKIAEEYGEVASALLAYHNDNPRKPAGELGPVLDELADVVVSAWGAGEHLLGNTGVFGRIVEHRAAAVLARLRKVAAGGARVTYDPYAHLRVETCPSCKGAGMDTSARRYAPESCPDCFGAGWVGRPLDEVDLSPEDPALDELEPEWVPCDDCPEWHPADERRCPRGDGSR